MTRHVSAADNILIASDKLTGEKKFPSYKKGFRNLPDKLLMSVFR